MYGAPQVYDMHTGTGLTLRALQKEKEELDDITLELELADEDDKLPSVSIATSQGSTTTTTAWLIAPIQHQVQNRRLFLPCHRDTSPGDACDVNYPIRGGSLTARGQA